MIGVLVLLAGIAGAGLLYWAETRSAEPTMDELMPGYSKMEKRQMGILFGGTGVVLSDGLDDLKRPDTQATIIVVVSVLFAWGCFYVARGLEDADDDSPPGSEPDGRI